MVVILKMNRALLLFIAISFISLTYGAIYHTDDRQLITNHSAPNLQYWAQSIAAQLDHHPKSSDSGQVRIKTVTLNEKMGHKLCPDVRFRDQITFSKCTAFLVAPDILITAGHCVNSQKQCEQSSWIFTHNMKASEQGFLQIPKKNIYYCKELIQSKKNRVARNDFAVVRLKSPARNRPFLKFRDHGKLPHNARLTVLGHPSGLPLTATGQDQVIDNANDFFFTIDSDTFHGNSGSPVINLDTQEVEGVLVDGSQDFKKDQSRACTQYHLCHDSTLCKGEYVTRITVIPFLTPHLVPAHEPVFDLTHGGF